MFKLPLHKTLAIYGTAAFFLLTPLWSFLFQGPFRWHVLQPEAWQGAIELVVLFCLVYFSIATKNSETKYIAFFLPLEIYARRHGVDFSIIVLYIYIQGIFSLGWLTMSISSAEPHKHTDKIYISLFFGLCIWLLTTWVVSGIGFGTAESIRLVAFCVLGSSILFGKAPQLIKIISPWLSVKRTTERISVALVTVLFFVLFAKISSAQVINYDSMWYGLQLEKSMLSAGSIYTDQGLVAMVHYYPKLYESLLIPFAGLGSISLLMGLAVFFWLALILTCYSILREFYINNTLSLLMVTLIATIPALGSIAMTTKGDVFATWLGLLAILFLLRFHRTKIYLFFWASISALALSPLARLSVIPYVALIAPLLVYYGFKFRGNKKITSEWLTYVLPLSALFVFFLVNGRSIALSGVPFVAPDQLVKIATYLGMELNYPVGGTPSAGRSTIPFVLGCWSYLFAPANMAILLITWIGNAWLFFPIFAIATSNKWLKYMIGFRKLFLIIGMLLPLVLFTTKVPPGRGLDGNYFIFPIVSIFIFSGFMLDSVFRCCESLVSRLILTFAIFSTAVIFVTSDWGPGTRPFDLNFKRTPFELDSKSKAIFRDKDKAGVLNYFKTVSVSSRVIGVNVQGDGDFSLGWWLPVRYEPIEIISWSRPELLSTMDSFEVFLKNTNIDYLVLSKNYIKDCKGESVCGLLKRWDAEGKSIAVLENGKYLIWKIVDSNLPLKYSKKLNVRGDVNLVLSPDSTCASLNNLEVKVSWNFPSVEAGIRVEVKSKTSLTSTPWLESGSTGISTTGPWIAPGSAFVFKTLTDNQTLGTVLIEDCGGQLRGPY